MTLFISLYKDLVNNSYAMAGLQRVKVITPAMFLDWCNTIMLPTAIKGKNRQQQRNEIVISFLDSIGYFDVV